ncbi:hypothetical protein QX776_11540 [Alteromonadaceae bacterium BrNp21-10]|nr:hypothetical protein [Alteromonadaceae bacterium BrNp21-10]
MLINTVLLFIGDALPVFLLVTLLLSVSDDTPQHLLHSFYSAFCISILAIYLVTLNLPRLSMSFDDYGVELLHVLLLLLGYISILGYSCLKTQFRPRLSFLTCTLALTSYATTNGSSLPWFFMSHQNQFNNLQAIVIGSLLGIGICLSTAILLHLTLQALQRSQIASVLLCAFCAGQSAGGLALLQQVNLIEESPILWNTQPFLADTSEIGQLLGALIGYDASPNLNYVLVYIIAFSLLWLLPSYIQRRHPISESSQ